MGTESSLRNRTIPGSPDPRIPYSGRGSGGHVPGAKTAPWERPHSGPPDTIREVPGSSGDVADRLTEIEERLAIQREAELAVPQTVPQATMLTGLMKVAKS